MKINHANFYFQKCVYQTGVDLRMNLYQEVALRLTQEFGNSCLKP